MPEIAEPLQVAMALAGPRYDADLVCATQHKRCEQI